MGVFDFYILQHGGRFASCAFDKASCFTLACVSLKWEPIKLIDRSSVEMMHCPSDCFHSHYSERGVISRLPADTAACDGDVSKEGPVTSAIALIFACQAQSMEQNNGLCAFLSIGLPREELVKGRWQPCYLWTRLNQGLGEISLRFCLEDVIVLPVRGILGGICQHWPSLLPCAVKKSGKSYNRQAWPLL